jgi:hypothetical protein
MMTFEELTESTGMRVALGAAVIGVALCGWMLTRAIKIDEVGTAPATVSVVPGALDIPESRTEVDVRAAVAADLFAVDRTAPKERYHMPGEALAEGKVEPSKPIVLGTAIAADGSSFATVQFESSRLHMMHVGDTLGGYTVKFIGRGRVVFLTTAGTSLEILAPQQGS